MKFDEVVGDCGLMYQKMHIYYSEKNIIFETFVEVNNTNAFSSSTRNDEGNVTQLTAIKFMFLHN